MSLVHWSKMVPGMLVRNACCNTSSNSEYTIDDDDDARWSGDLGVLLAVRPADVGSLVCCKRKSIEGVICTILWSNKVQTETPFYDEWHIKV